MGSTSETGHVINIANFKKIIDNAAILGVTYNPSNINLTIAKMMLQWNSVNTLQSSFTLALQTSKNPINDRVILFKPINTLTTKIINLLNSTNAPDDVKTDAKGLADLIRGAGLLPKKLEDGTPNPDFISKSHQSFVQKQDAFKQLADLLGTIPQYTPNEVPLQVVTLKALATALKTSNDNISTIIAPVSSARIARDHALYDTQIGLVDNAQAAKKYVKAIFGTTSPEAQLINSLKFTRKKA